MRSVCEKSRGNSSTVEPIPLGGQPRVCVMTGYGFGLWRGMLKIGSKNDGKIIKNVRKIRITE